jgi:hypothetical protein
MGRGAVYRTGHRPEGESCGALTNAEGGRQPPPEPVVKAAERAFRERETPRAGKVALVYDSFRDDAQPGRAPRLLMFTAGSLDLLLTIASTPKGNLVGGWLLGTLPVAVGIRRPLRATIALHAGEDGMLAETLVPPGTASVLVHAATGRSWQSDWMTL